MNKPHLVTLHPCLADLWERITKEFGFFRFRWENQIACFAEKNDLQIAWELFREQVENKLDAEK